MLCAAALAAALAGLLQDVIMAAARALAGDICVEGMACVVATATPARKSAIVVSVALHEASDAEDFGATSFRCLDSESPRYSCFGPINREGDLSRRSAPFPRLAHAQEHVWRALRAFARYGLRR